MAIRLAFPITIQTDRTIWLETRHPEYEQARDALARFADLERSAGSIHVYRMTPLSVWNAAALGLTAEEILAGLEQFSGGHVPETLRQEIREWMARYGRFRLEMEDGRLWLVADDPALLAWAADQSVVAPFLRTAPGGSIRDRVEVEPRARGHLKQALLYLGYPVEDAAGYIEGARLDLRLRPASRSTGEPFRLRPYQEEAVEAFLQAGSGVVLLPCGAGKTIVGLGVMARLQTATLIIATNTVAARQWIAEILDKTDLSPDQIGEYTGHRKQIRPVTVATYQILTHRPRRDFEEDLLRQFPHFRLFNALDWGLIIYDEVHLLPAPVFRITAQLQARRRLGLTATLVREDGLEREVFALIGPKRYEAPWRELEARGWIAAVECHEVRVPMGPEDRLRYATAEESERYRLAATNRAKEPVVRQLLEKHLEDTVLIIGHYLDQLERIARAIRAPLITGRTPVVERERLFDQLRRGEIRRLVVSRVGNFAIDLPDANVLIQVSGTFGSRQEEAQRLGRILRPKRNGVLAHFYTLVSRDTVEQDYAARRQLFLTEQGYRYEILEAEELPAYHPAVADVPVWYRSLPGSRSDRRGPSSNGHGSLA
ncbi:DNA repair helicase XPB [Thermoflexus sp.]|uniref:DNA repair helicase XPB n=1 Tax=Thermoflexus sp. TaxID=1969742 RepID=UPI001750A097|nr:DNA repair helicase XPB [Thermoflexus sp.]